MKLYQTLIFVAVVVVATTVAAMAQDDGDVTAVPSEPIQLDQVDVPQDTLAAATVETSTGEPIGEVQNVILDEEGQPATVVIDADRILGDDEEVIEIEAERLAYLPDDNVLITDLSADEIRGMAQAE